VQVDGQPLLRPRPQTGLILQDYGLLPWATVRENAALGERIRRFYGPDGRHAPAAPLSAAAVDAWLERLGLNEVANQYPGKLSGGQRQRTAIARTLALSPDLLLMDEPFSSLDALTRQDLQQLTLQLWREKGFTFIMVTHAIEEAAALGQQVLVLGKPPHRTPVILPNPAFSQPLGSPVFTAFCAALRAQLEAV
jgi:NitT/TauT family transport system ATP-binding protein